jgi:predicted nucleic acid-binding Zn ribbon protein
MGIRQARSAPALMPKGECHFCGEEVADGLRFCGPDCRDDFQAEEEALKRMGKPEE